MARGGRCLPGAGLAEPLQDGHPGPGRLWKAQSPLALRRGCVKPLAMTDGTPKPGGERPPPQGPLPEVRPPKVQPRIIAAPKLRQLYWCDFWRDAQLPEMWKTRPVVVVSYRNGLRSPCTVVPTSTEPQSTNPWAVELSSSIDGQRSWAVCNQPSTIAPSRLSQVKGKIPLISEADFNQILARLIAWLPTPFDLEK